MGRMYERAILKSIKLGGDLTNLTQPACYTGRARPVAPARVRHAIMPVEAVDERLLKTFYPAREFTIAM
jgi:hypothetical protein